MAKRTEKLYWLRRQILTLLAESDKSGADPSDLYGGDVPLVETYDVDHTVALLRPTIGRSDPSGSHSAMWTDELQEKLRDSGIPDHLLGFGPLSPPSTIDLAEILSTIDALISSRLELPPIHQLSVRSLGRAFDRPESTIRRWLHDYLKKERFESWSEFLKCADKAAMNRTVPQRREGDEPT